MAFVAPLIPVVTGAVAASSVAGMLMIGSAAVGAISAVTGNKTLQKLGTLVGLGTGLAAATGLIGTQAAAAGASSASKLALGDPTVASRAMQSAIGKVGSAVTGVVNNGVTGAAVNPQNTVLAGVDPSDAIKARDLAVRSRLVDSQTGREVLYGKGQLPLTTVLPDQTSRTPAQVQPGFMEKILGNPQNMYGAGLIAQGAGSALSGAFAAGTEEDKLEFLKQQEAAKQAEIERRNRNFNNISEVDLGIRPSGVGLYQRPRGLIWPYRSPVLPQ